MVDRVVDRQDRLPKKITRADMLSSVGRVQMQSTEHIQRKENLKAVQTIYSSLGTIVVKKQRGDDYFYLISPTHGEEILTTSSTLASRPPW